MAYISLGASNPIDPGYFPGNEQKPAATTSMFNLLPALLPAAASSPASAPSQVIPAAAPVPQPAPQPYAPPVLAPAPESASTYTPPAPGMSTSKMLMIGGAVALTGGVLYLVLRKK